MEKLTRLLKKYNVSFDELIELVNDDILATSTYSVAYASLQSLYGDAIRFSVAMYDGGGTFKSTHQKYTYQGLENILKRNF